MKYFSFLFLLLGLPLLALAQDTGFVPLTNIPAITEVGNAITTPDGLSIFLNNIYRLAIGIAAVVAVLQIMRAGIMYMGGDSVTEKKEAKNLIALSIGGLILVLSPVVVFSIINPEILSLKINKLGELKATPPSGSGELDTDTQNATAWTSETIDRQGQKAMCESQGRRMVFACRSAEGVERDVPETEACATSETNVNRCLFNEGEQSQSCPANLTRTRVFTRSCPADNGYTQIPKSCCSLEASDSRTCCGSSDGRGADDPSIGSFYTQKTFEAKPGADAYAQACSNLRSFHLLVSGREGDVKELPRPANSNNTPFVGRCFSYSIMFGEYQLKENSTGDLIATGDLRETPERDPDVYKNSCRDEGGTAFYRRAIRPSFLNTECTEAQIASVFRSVQGTSRETHTVFCREVDYVCRAN